MSWPCWSKASASARCCPSRVHSSLACSKRAWTPWMASSTASFCLVSRMRISFVLGEKLDTNCRYVILPRLTQRRSLQDGTVAIHFFRYSHLPENSIRAILDGKASLDSFKYEAGKAELKRIAVVLQNKIFGLPANDTPVSEWKWWLSFVLGTIRQHDSEIYLKNLIAAYHKISIRPHNNETGKASGALLLGNVHRGQARFLAIEIYPAYRGKLLLGTSPYSGH